MDVFLAHHADDGFVEGLGEAVVHVLPEQDHLAEDRARSDDGGGQRSAVGRDAEHADRPRLRMNSVSTGLCGENSSSPAE